MPFPVELLRFFDQLTRTPSGQPVETPAGTAQEAPGAGEPPSG
jgi:hypothetical protein